MKIAVVADVHLHDLYGGYGMVEEGSGGLSLRTFADTMASTRVFNESYPAFLAALDDIVQRNIRDVVLLGDYSDDGQLGSVSAVKRILSLYEAKHGLRFFATFGNHDSYGPQACHQAKRLTKADGSNSALVSSDERAEAPAMICSGMRGMSTLEAMGAMASYGISRPSNVIYWETPFGDRENLHDRHPENGDAADLDASYLVEPQKGLWLLVLDANVFQNIDNKWQVRADAAWDHVLAQRPYMLDWVEDVAQRAKQYGKTLLAFSHYPVLPLALAGEGDAIKAACTPDWLKRMPSLESARRLANAGVRWHFSGHMHVSGRVELDNLVNIAVPSPVAYPGGYVIVSATAGNVDIETVQISDVIGFDVAFEAYRMQAIASDQMTSAIDANSYKDFLRSHLRNLIWTRHVPSDWAPELIDCLDLPVEVLFADSDLLSALMKRWPDMSSLKVQDMIEDYYFLRADNENTLAHLANDKRGFYSDLRCALQSQNPLIQPSYLGQEFLTKFAAYIC